MKELLTRAVSTVTTLDETKKAVVSTLTIVKRNHPKIGYVSGVVSSDGEEYIARNKQILATYTLQISQINNIPTFSTVDIFSTSLVKRLNLLSLQVELRENKLRQFWKEILSLGLVTDVYMTPRWERSKGAQLEYQSAKKHGLTIHYVAEPILIIEKRLVITL